nr:MAG TPA: hypothetical protein [Caudoviricetes sp.]
MQSGKIDTRTLTNTYDIGIIYTKINGSNASEERDFV